MPAKAYSRYGGTTIKREGTANMKRQFSIIAVMALLLTMTLTVTALNPADETVPLDTTVFYQTDNYELYDCGCMELLGLCHMSKGGITFFEWASENDKMSAKGLSCFWHSPEEPDDPLFHTVVFLNGVPNLVNDLFKYLEGTTQDVYIPDSVKEIDEECFVMNSRITLHFTKNNAVALAYAQNRGMAFEVMDGERLPGDVDFDKNVDMKDVLSLRKAIANFPAAYEIYSTDLNADDSTDMKDVLILRKQIAKVEK